MIQVEVVYARPHQQWTVILELAEGTSAEIAVAVAKKSEPMLWIEAMNVVAYSVWGEEVPSSYVLKDGDRLELLRPLPIQPMEARRKKALNRNR